MNAINFIKFIIDNLDICGLLVLISYIITISAILYTFYSIFKSPDNRRYKYYTITCISIFISIYLSALYYDKITIQFDIEKADKLVETGDLDEAFEIYQKHEGIRGISNKIEQIQDIEWRYNKGIALMYDEEYMKAMRIFIDIYHYKDSRAMFIYCSDMYMITEEFDIGGNIDVKN